jgi:histidyl-tRNA synthetase
MSESTKSSNATFDQWAIVDVMGHQRYVGRVTEEVIAGCGFVRIDIPAVEGEPAWTKLVGTSSIYAITPVEKDIAMALAARSRKRPVEAYELTPPMVRQASLPYLDDDAEFRLD